MFAEIRSTLSTSLNLDDNQKSSHWKFHTKEAEVVNNRIQNINGFSSRSKVFFLSKLLHTRAQKKIFKNFDEVVKTEYYDLARKICKVQGRELDVCVMRHVFTFNLLNEFKFLNKNLICCVIGDGQSNFISMASLGNYFTKLISINLGEVLLSDLDLLEKLTIKIGSIRIVQNESELKESMSNDEIKIILIQAHNKELLADQKIDLFINIASFQEMTPEIVSQYFQVIESNNAHLYCCNREVKALVGGEILKFDSYPWGEAKILLDSICGWHTHFYDFKSLRLFRRLSYDGIIRHRLVKF